MHACSGASSSHYRRARLRQLVHGGKSARSGQFSPPRTGQGELGGARRKENEVLTIFPKPPRSSDVMNPCDLDTSSQIIRAWSLSAQLTVQQGSIHVFALLYAIIPQREASTQGGDSVSRSNLPVPGGEPMPPRMPSIENEDGGVAYPPLISGLEQPWR